MNLQETIRRILREEVNEAYVKPNESTNRLINNWLTKLFAGSKMWHQKSYETRHDFYWCNNGKQIANVILFFTDDNSVYPDKRPTRERDFYEGNLSIPKSIIDDLITYVPIRKHYLKHRIIEWFEENIFSEVIEKMGRDDIEIDGISEYPENVEVCVPPVEKPEGITQEEMIDLILKTTLFKRNELLKYEEDSPGYIERVYLGKLQNAEIERLRGGVNESELTEKCWPGYTQKGMKTMFGKRYPNCVKKTKK